MTDKLSRRRFLKGVAAAGVYGAAVLSSGSSAADARTKSRIVIVKGSQVLVDPKTNKNALANTKMASVGSSDPSIDQFVLDRMVSQGMQAFTGKNSDAEAWKKLFGPSDVVGIKVNAFCGMGAATHPEVVAPVIAGLKLAGVREQNIIVWEWLDRHLISSGFRVNRTHSGFLCYGTEDQFEEQPTTVGSFSGRLSKILTQKITALINIPILKDHNCAGITCAMKNHYGSIHNPSECHGSNCNPIIAELNSIAAIKNKTRLVIADALLPVAEGGPSFTPRFVWRHGSIHIGADPVAIDYLGWQVVDAQRKKMGLPTLVDAGRPPKWIATSSSMGLGTDDPAQIEITSKTM